MPTYTAPIDDFRFHIHEVLQVSSIQALPSIQQADTDIIDAVLNECGRFCESVLQPINAPGDQTGCQWNDGQVATPPGFRDAYRQFTEAGWPGLTSDPAYGGQGLPYVLGLALAEMVAAANTSWGMYPALAHGAWETIAAHGTETQKETYLPQMIAGQWTGTMNLTESHCGTDLGLLRSRAEPADDGSYRISGTKIWISAGEHDLAENIIHLVLARLPDAPEGTNGISLFIVPKYLINADGSLGEHNRLRCESIDHKLGIRGSATCEMVYDRAVGYLLGEPNRGLKCMFTMMNAARLETGIQGLGLGSVSYQNAVHFARERLQGRSLDGARYPDRPADPIIVHPDVRRMLLTMRAFVEGARGLGLYTALELEMERHHPDPDRRRRAGHWVALMTPVIKAYFTDMGFESASQCLQVHGGAGYIVDTGVEQFLRDARIGKIYEGTNGVQALDLVGRKLVAEQGEVIHSFFLAIDELKASAQGRGDMAEFVDPVSAAAARLQETTTWVYRQMAADPLEAGAASVDYLHQFALTAMAWSWARQAQAALDALADGRGQPAFYRSKLDCARFFMARLLPDTLGLDARVRAGAATLMAPHEDAF